MAAIDRLKNQHSGTDNIGNLGNLGQQQAHSSQPEACRITLDPTNINPSVFSSEEEIALQDSVLDSDLPLRPDRQITMPVQGTEPPQVGYLKVGRQATQGVDPPQAGHLQVGRQAMLDIRIPEMGHLQVGRMFQAEQEVSLEHVIKTKQVKTTC
jgi:hypothetical protein